MTENVLRIAQHRQDARTDPDYRMAYSSVNRSLPIVRQDKFIVTNTGGAKQTIYQHNLGLIPMFLIHRVVDDRLEFANDDLLGIRMNRNELYTTGGDLTEIVFTIFSINLEEPYDSGSGFIGVKESAEGEEQDAYVFKAAKANRNTDSPDLRDYTTNTEARNPMVHKVVQFSKNTGSISDPLLTVDHGLDYAPIPLAYGASATEDKETFQFFQLGPVSGLGIRIKSNRKQVIMTDSSSASRYGSLVILTDPVLLT